jgi:hypothetical protein
MKANKLVFILLVPVMAGCTKNPLQSKWRAVGINNGFGVCQTMEFTSNRQLCDSLATDVDYEISNDSVIVKSKERSQLENFDINYKVVSKDIISFTYPFSQKEIYFVKDGFGSVTPEAIKYSQQYSLEQLQKSCDSGPAKVEHPSKYWSEVVPKQIHDDICSALKIKKSSG